jgi:hypothetical protein
MGKDASQSGGPAIRRLLLGSDQRPRIFVANRFDNVPIRIYGRTNFGPARLHLALEDQSIEQQQDHGADEVYVFPVRSIAKRIPHDGSITPRGDYKHLRRLDAVVRRSLQLLLESNRSGSRNVISRPIQERCGFGD